MPRKTNKEKSDRRGGRRTSENRTPRPKPKIDFTVDALDYKNVTLLKQFVTDQGRITNGDLGLWSSAHMPPLQRFAAFAKTQGVVPAIICALALIAVCIWYGRKTGCDNGDGRASGTEIWRAFKDAGPALVMVSPSGAVARERPGFPASPMCRHRVAPPRVHGPPNDAAGCR